MPKTSGPLTTPDYIKEKLTSLMTNAPAVALNYIAHVTGITSVQAHSNLSLEQFHSPKAHTKILTDYEKSIKVKGLIQPVDELLKGLTAQLDGIRSTTTGLEDFKKKIEDHETLTEAEKEAKIKFSEGVEKTLGPTRATSPEVQDFQKRLEILLELLNKDETDNPRVIVAYIDDEYHKLIKQLQDDKQHALEAVTKQFGELKGLGGGAMSAKELDEMQKEMEKRITDSYDKAQTELDKLYEKGTPAATEKDKAVPGLRERFVKTADQAEQELINLVLYAEHTDSKAIPTPKTLSAGAGVAPDNDGPGKYRNVGFDEYLAVKPERASTWFSSQAWSDYLKFLCNQNHELYTPSGLLLNHQKNDKGETIIAITLPAGFGIYHHYYDNQLESDLLCMMNELKAKGKDEVNITINIHNPALRQEIMEKAYIAAKLAGFPDEKIKFNVTFHEDDKRTINDKTAKEIRGQLGQAPSRAQTIQNSWNAQKKAAENPQKLRAEVASLDRKINGILDTKPIKATTSDLEDDSAASSAPRPFSVRR